MLTTAPLIQKAKEVTDAYFKEKTTKEDAKVQAFFHKAFSDISNQAYQEGSLQQMNTRELQEQVETLNAKFDHLLQQVSQVFNEEGKKSSSLKYVSERYLEQQTALENANIIAEKQEKALKTLQQSIETYQENIEQIQQKINEMEATQYPEKPPKEPTEKNYPPYIKSIVTIPYPILFRFITALILALWGLEKSKKYLPKEGLVFPLAVFSTSLKGMCVASAIFLVIKCFFSLTSIQVKKISWKLEQNALEQPLQSIFLKRAIGIGCIGMSLFIYRKKIFKNHQVKNLLYFLQGKS